VNKFFREAHAITWTIAGTGLVLITLAGKTRVLGLWISAIAIIIHFVGSLFRNEE